MLLSFKPRFADMVVRGLLGDDTGKRQTIRAPRKDGRLPLPGEALHLYTGIRTKKCRKLGVAICEKVWMLTPLQRHGFRVRRVERKL